MTNGNLNIPGRSRPTRGFTLIELVVVIGIIILLIAIAVPAVGPALSSSHQTQVIQSLTSAVTLAQIRAEGRGGYAIRIERAFKTDHRGYMVDAKGQTRDDYYSGLGSFDANSAPVWLDHQQIRFLNAPRDTTAYRPAVDDVIPLPKKAWLAPDYALDTTYFNSDYFISQNVEPGHPAVPSTWVNPFETFCIAFDQRGGVVQLRNGVSSDNYSYSDDTQPDASGISPVARHFYASARGVILYDRAEFEQAGAPTLRGAYLAREGRTFYINRFLGTLVEGRYP